MDFLKKYSFLLILLLGIFLRFYHFPFLYSLDGDGVRDAIVAHEGSKQLYFPTVGAFSSTGPYTFGPWYWISLICISFLFPFIYTPWVVMGIVSLLTVILMYKIGASLLSKNFGLFLALLTVLAPSEISVGTTVSNISPVPFFVTLTIWLMIKIYKEKLHFLWYLALGIALGLGINAHYQVAGLLLLPLLLWFYKKDYKILTFVPIGLLITFIPLLIFNLQTYWQTIQGIHVMYISRGAIYVPNSWKIYLFQFWPSMMTFIFTTIYPISFALFYGTITTLLYKIVKKKLPVIFLMLFLTFLINFILLRFYWGARNHEYLYYLEPIIILFVGYILFTSKKVIFYIASFILITSMLISYISHMQQSPQSSLQEDLRVLAKTYPNKEPIIYACDVGDHVQPQALIYLLSFRSPKDEKIKIGVIDTKCHYPKTKNSKYIFHPLRDTNLIDFSTVSQSAIKKASWSAMTTQKTFDSVVKWWN